MLTWILLAIIVAALFGLINFEEVRHWSVNKAREAWPHVHSFFNRVGEKMESAKAKVENTKEKLSDKFDKAGDKAEEYKAEAENDFDNDYTDDEYDNNNKY